MIGIISDTHEQEDAIKKAVAIFKERNVEFVVHCGDIISPPVLENFEGLKMLFVFGNNDGEKKRLNERATQEFGWEKISGTKRFSYKNRRFFVCHGHETDMLGLALKSEKYDYILTGHTHHARSLKKGKTRIINPGSLFRSPKNIVVLDVENDEAEFLEID